MTKPINNYRESYLENLTLDTHVLIWYAEGIKLTEKQINLIEKAREKGALYISAISIWEISLLASKNKMAFSISITEWVDKLLSTPGLNLIALSVPILIQSCELPNYEHRDPADRLIIASTRFINSHLMTYDQKIIDYANNGYLKIANSDY